MKLILVFVTVVTFCLTFFGCQKKSTYFDKWKYSGNLVSGYVKELEIKESLKQTAFGGSYNGGSVNYVDLDFMSSEKVNLTEARNLIIKVTDGLINIFNQDKIIRPYLADFPFTSSNFIILIVFKNFTDMENNLVNLIHLKDGVLSYYYYDEKGQEVCFRETYLEAKDILEDKK